MAKNLNEYRAQLLKWRLKQWEKIWNQFQQQVRENRREQFQIMDNVDKRLTYEKIEKIKREL